MAITLRAVGPVDLYNISTGKDKSVPLISFNKQKDMTVDIDGAYVTLHFKNNEYQGVHNGHSYRCANPKFQAIEE